MAILEGFKPSEKPQVQSVTVLVQAEVADRLCAKEGTNEYGAITAAISLYGSVKKLFDVSAGNFNPKPKVDSAVVRIALDNPQRYTDDERRKALLLIKAAFGQRRKPLVNSLSSVMPSLCIQTKDELAEKISETLGKPQDVRGERLSGEDFVKLGKVLVK